MLASRITGGFAATSAPDGFDLDFEKVVIASTREPGSTVVSELRREDIIETPSRRIAIRDRGALSKQASGPSGLTVDGQLPI